MAAFTPEDDVFAQHVIEAGFLWILRDQAVGDAAYDLARLTELDYRVDANLDGLRLAEDRGWAHALDAVEDGEAGEVFVAGVLAVGRADLEGIARVLDAVEGEPALARGLESALGWSELRDVRAILPGLFDASCPPELHWLGVAGCAAHRDDPGLPVSLAAGSDDTRLRTRALRAAGEFGRMDFLPALTAELDAADEELRYAAAWSGALLGNPLAVEALFAFAKEGGRHAEDAADLAARAMEPAAALQRIQSLARSPRTVRSAIRGALALGDPGLVPWLLDCCEDDALARPAGWAITVILGVDLVSARARTRAPAGFKAGPSEDPADSNVAMDADESLQWPSAQALKKIWERDRDRFQRGKRYVLGREVTPEQLQRTLQHGVQPIRRGAALDLALRAPGRPLFQTAAPGFRQKSVLP